MGRSRPEARRVFPRHGLSPRLDEDWPSSIQAMEAAEEMEAAIEERREG